MKPAAHQLIAELDECSSSLVADRDGLVTVLEAGIRESGLSLVATYVHEYEPHGLTVVAIINESHVIIHTYPEAAHASVDIFTCAADPKKCSSLLGYLQEALCPRHVRTGEVERGEMLELVRPGRVNLASTDGIDVSLQLSERLFSARTKHQHVVIGRSPQFGKMLILDNYLQLTEADAERYASKMAAPLAERLRAGSRVLLLGGGDGSVLRELLTLPVSEVTVIELDEEMMRICAQHLPELGAPAFSDPRVRLVISDAIDYLPSSERYDAAVCDLTLHPEAFVTMPRRSYLELLFSRLLESLSDGAGLSVQCCSELDHVTLGLLNEILEPRVKELTFEKAYIPSYATQWVFAYATV